MTATRPATRPVLLILALAGLLGMSAAAVAAPAAAPTPRAAPASPAQPAAERSAPAPRSAAGSRRRRSYASCNRISHQRGLSGGVRRRFLIRCRLGYERRGAGQAVPSQGQQLPPPPSAPPQPSAAPPGQPPASAPRP